MLDKIVDSVVDLKMFIIVTAAATVIIGFFLLFYCRKFSFDGNNVKSVGFFYQLSRWDTLGLAVSLVKVCLFVSLIMMRGNVKNIHIAVYVMLHVLYMLHKRSLKSLPADLITGVATAGVMSIMGMLFNYLRDVIFDWRIQAVIILMMILICGYALCDMFRCCNRVIMITKAKGNSDEQ